MPIGYNPWGVPNQGAPQIEQPKRIGDCIGFTNSDGQNYYDPYSNYRDYYGYNMYNSYFNPYEMEKRREEEQKRQKELALSKIRFQESLDRSSCTYKGVDVYIPTAEEQLEMAEEKYSFILEYQSIRQRHEQFEFQDNFHIVTDEPPQPIPREPVEKEHVNVKEWIDNIGYEYAKSLQEKVRLQNRDLSRAYDSNQYKQLLNTMGSGNSALDALSRDFTIDDMEVQLPDKFSKEYQERRRRFLNALLE